MISKEWKRMLLVLVAVGYIWTIVGCGNSAPEAATTNPPAVKSTNEDGGSSNVMRFSLSDLEGKNVEVGPADQVTIVNFWATWCPPCKAEMPELDKFAENNKGKIRFFAVNIQQEPNVVKDFMVQNGYKMNVLVDRDGSVSRSYRVSAIPTTFILDKKGTVRYKKTGAITQEELENKIAEIER